MCAPSSYNIQFSDFENQELREYSICVHKYTDYTEIPDAMCNAGRGAGGGKSQKEVQSGPVYQRSGAHPRVRAIDQSLLQNLSWACLSSGFTR